MREELDRKLCEAFPHLYRDRNESMMVTCMSWGFEHSDGWFQIIWDLSEALEKEILALPEDQRSQCRAMQVKEKYGCYDSETELLTKNGWKFFKDTSFDDDIATLNNNHLEYHRPVDIISYDYIGKMYRLKTRGVDLLVTPNHNLYVAKGTYYNGRYDPPKKVDYPFEFTTPDKYFGKNKRFLKGCIWSGKEEKIFTIPSLKRSNYFSCGLAHDKRKIERTYNRDKIEFDMSTWVEFLGFYIAEGCSSIKRNTVSVACCNVDKGETKKYLEKLLTELKIDFSLAQKDKPACVYRIYDTQISEWLYKNCGHLAPNKKVPDFVKELSSDLIKLFLKGLYTGDGNLQKTSHVLTTTSKKLCDDVQELLLKAGYSSYYFIRPISKVTLVNDRSIQGNFPSYEINWLKKSFDHNTQNKGLSASSIEEWTEYTGKVFCVTVPNNILYVRRNGIPVWCGNSLRYYMTSGTDKMYDLINEAELKSETTCEVCGSPGKIRGCGWLYTACDEHTKDCDKIEYPED